MTALLALDTHGHLSIPDRAARYTLQRRDAQEGAEWETVEDLTMPDGTLAGATMELLASAMLTDLDALAALDEGVVSITAPRVSFRFVPTGEWTALTAAHPLAARYTVEGTHAGRGTWTTANVRRTEVTRAEVRELTNLSSGGDVALHGSGVIIVEASHLGFALRLTPIPEPAYRQEQWGSREVAKYLRSLLRKTFPGQKFSVRCGRGSDYGYLSIRWTGGPTEEQVKAVCDPWQGSDFDGSTDYMNQREPLLIHKDGELVEVRPVTDLFDYTRERPDGVEDQAKKLVRQQTGAAWDARFNDPRPFSYQGETFFGVTASAQLTKIMDAIEAGAIRVD
ncbi:LPD29 domain-containing protein [Streptomyces sp. NPDC001118]